MDLISSVYLKDVSISSNSVNPPTQSTVAAEGLRSKQRARRYVWDKKVTTVDGVIIYLKSL